MDEVEEGEVVEDGTEKAEDVEEEAEGVVKDEGTRSAHSDHGFEPSRETLRCFEAMLVGQSSEPLPLLPIGQQPIPDWVNTARNDAVNQKKKRKAGKGAGKAVADPEAYQQALSASKTLRRYVPRQIFTAHGMPTDILDRGWLTVRTRDLLQGPAGRVVLRVMGTDGTFPTAVCTITLFGHS
jgi:hypothetical protein